MGQSLVKRLLKDEHYKDKEGIVGPYKARIDAKEAAYILNGRDTTK